MLAWNDLPVASKKEVIKRLDLMSRTAMRCTSRAHREIVDATEFYVPRVRFATKKTACLIMIYTDIEKFLRIEIDKMEQGVMVYRMENTYDRSDATKHAIPTITSEPLAYKVLKSLFIHDSVLLGALEIEFPLSTSIYAQRMTIAYMYRALGGGRFRTKKFVTNCHIENVMELMLYKNICVVEELEELRNEGVRLATEQLECRKIMDMTILPEEWKDPSEYRKGQKTPIENFIHVPSYETHMWLAELRLEAPLMLIDRAQKSRGFVTVRFGLFPGEPDLWECQGFPIERLNEHILMKRYVSFANMTVRWNKSKCGTWVHMVRSDEEHKYLDFFKNEKCGLRWLCRKCTDPFEQWFYKEMPRRIYHEPEWNFISLRFESNDLLRTSMPSWKHEELEAEVRANFAEDEKKRANNKKKVSAESWGFKPSTKSSGFKGSWLWNSCKKAPIEFVCGKDFDDVEVYEKAGKTLQVLMVGIDIATTEWVTVKQAETNTLTDVFESMGLEIVKPSGGPSVIVNNKVNREALEKNMPPLHEMLRKLVKSRKDYEEEEDGGASDLENGQ